jgi:hypothetical protein
MPRDTEEFEDDEVKPMFSPNSVQGNAARSRLDNEARAGITEHSPLRNEIRVSPKLKQLSEEDYQLFISKVSLGCSDYSAAAILGVTSDTYRKWLYKGEHSNHGLYRRLYLDVIRAKGIARCSAEIQVKREKPEVWLTKFGGKSVPGVNGWTELTEQEKQAELQLEFESSNADATTTEQPGSQRLLPSAGTFNEALASLQELGLIAITEHGKNVLNIQESIPLDTTTIDVSIRR